MKKEDIEHLRQLIISLEDSMGKLEIAYEKKDSGSFEKLKKFIINLQMQILEITR